MSRIVYDWTGDEPPPTVGDALICVRRRDGNPTGTCYLILGAREVNRISPEPDTRRMRYTVERIDLDDALRTPRWETLVWNPR